MDTIEQEAIDRFNSKWLAVGDCKLWQHRLDKDGYGSFYFRKKNRRAHRVAFYFSFGDIDDGMVIDHLCKNRNCVEISHLRKITIRENALDNSNSVGAINSRKTSCKNGHPLDRKYGNQRYCSICQANKTKRLRSAWRVVANKTKC